jgi:hypothetical protein
VVCCAFLALPLLCTPFADGQNARPRERHVRKIPFTTRPIAESLRPDDDIVIVEWDIEDIVAADTTAFEALKVAVAHQLSTTAIVTVTGVSGVLALENSWIHTKFVATVDEVLKTGKDVTGRDRISRGQAVEFFVVGGEAAVNGVVVRAGDVVTYPIGRKYLVFLGRLQDENGFLVQSSEPLLLEGDRLSAVAPAKSKLSGLTLADVAKAVREAR